MQLSNEAGKRDRRLKAPGKLHRDVVSHLVLENQNLMRLGKDLRGCMSQSSVRKTHTSARRTEGTSEVPWPASTKSGDRESQGSPGLILLLQGATDQQENVTCRIAGTALGPAFT